MKKKKDNNLEIIRTTMITLSFVVQIALLLHLLGFIKMSIGASILLSLFSSSVVAMIIANVSTIYVEINKESIKNENSKNTGTDV